MERSINQNWDLESMYAGGSKSPALQELMASLVSEISRLTAALEAPINDMKQLTAILAETQHAMDTWLEIEDFSVCLYSENVEDLNALQLLDQSMSIKAAMKSFHALLNQTLAGIGEKQWEQLIAFEEIKPYSFSLNERRQKVKDRLPLEMERLIHALSVNGFDGWEQLHHQLFNQLKIPLERGGQIREVSFGNALNQAVYDADRNMRIQAASAITHICDAHAETFAVLLNRIAGFRLDLYKQRGWQNLLKEMLDQNRITEKSLESMLLALEESKPYFKDYLKRKKELLGLEEMNWYDLDVPCFKTDKKFPYSEAALIIEKQFHALSPRLGRFAEKAFRSQWIESENRPNKAEGAFCASLPLANESRIFLTYRENYYDVVTIAHELGHAYHNEILHNEPAFAKEKGTSIEETASIFMENLVLDAAVEQAESEEEKLALLEMKISSGLLCVSLIPNMFHFEVAFYEQRKHGLISAEKIKELLVKSESHLYEGLIKEHDVYRWLSIPHIYVTEKAFYNVPYTIGYLFSSGIYSLRNRLGKEFMDRYDSLLRNSGRMTIEQLGSVYLKQDLTEADFWRTAMEPLKNAIQEFLRLSEKKLRG